MIRSFAFTFAAAAAALLASSAFALQPLPPPPNRASLKRLKAFTHCAWKGPRRTELDDNRAAIERNKLIISLGKARKAQDILALFEKEKEQFNNINWSTTMTQLGRIRSLSPKDPKLLAFVESLADCLEERGMNWFGIRAVANLVYAIAKKKIWSPGAQRILKTAAEREHAKIIVTKGTPQAVANTAWACATLGVKSPNLFAKIDECAAWLVREGTPQAVANTAWAYATLGYKSPNLFASIEEHAAWLVSEGKPQEVANTAWAFATLGFKSPNLFGNVDKHAAWLVSEGNPQDIANMAWACATLGFKSPNLFANIDECAAWLVSEGNTQDAANTAWACATFGFKSPNLFAKIDEHAPWLFSEGNPQAVANIAWACATLGFQSPNLFAEIDNHATRLVSEGTPQTICTCCYALACLDLGKKHKDLLNQLWKKAMQQNPDLCQKKDLLQLAQVFAFCEADGIELDKPSETFAQQLRMIIVDERKSDYQREVSHFLTKLNVKHEEEVSPLRGSDLDAGMLAIDLALIADKVAIECDGQFHFLHELGTGKLTQYENGATQAKRRFLERLGWTVVNIDFRDWIAAREQKQQLEFLRGRLVQAGVSI